MQIKKRVVVIGGGTGTHTILRGLKQYQDTLDISAIVTMADSGGSTGRLRDEFGQLPVGDVRMALTALARDADNHEELVRQLFMHRFDRGSGLEGHNVGNLLLVALTDILGSEEAAIEAAAQVLGVQGTVIPVATEPTHLVAKYDDGVEVVGEHAIDEPTSERAMHKIAALSVRPTVVANPRAVAAISNADVVVLGPGDLYTSVLANCVVDGVAAALQETPASLVYVSNLMTKMGQTHDMDAAEHVAEITTYIGRSPDVVLVNTGEIPEELLGRYRAEGERPLRANCQGGTCVIKEEDFTAKEAVRLQSGDVLRRSLVRHDSAKLAACVMSLL